MLEKKARKTGTTCEASQEKKAAGEDQA